MSAEAPQKPKGPQKAVIFDLDGTLYSLKGSKKLFMALKLWRSIGILRHFNAVRQTVRHELFSDSDHLKLSLFHQLAARAHISKNRAEEWYNEEFWRAFIALLQKKAEPRPGLKEWLIKAKEKQIKLFIVSDYDHIAERLTALGLSAELFDLLLSSEEFGQLKPAPIAFQAALDSFKVAGSNSLIIGDSPALDEAGAKAAHIPFWGINDAGVPKEGYFSWPELLKKLNTLLEDKAGEETAEFN